MPTADISALDLSQPLFFSRNRVWRCYLGGLLLDQMQSAAQPKDNAFPEEWLASVTVATNGEHQQFPEEGLSRIKLDSGKPGPFLKDVIEQRKAECLGQGANGINVLCKFLDSAIRLPFQCHPDRAFAKQHYHSDFGKTETWFVLGTREINGERAHLYLGFKEGVQRKPFEDAVRKQDIPALLSMMHKVEAKAGEAYFIPGRLPHAIGPGCMIMEVQEPSDWVVQPERFVGDVELDEAAQWGPLTPELGLECFDVSGGSPLEGILKRMLLNGQPTEKQAGGAVEQWVTPSITDCFRVDLLKATGSYTLNTALPWHIGIVSEGQGSIATGGKTFKLKAGDCYFASNKIKDPVFNAEGKLSVFLIAGRK